MKIYEIRTQINEINSAKIFCISNGFMKPLTGDSWFQTAARILIDRTYEAGKAEGHLCDEGCCEDKWKLGYETAAKDPKAWYVLDKKGEQVHIGDEVFDGSDVWVVEGLSQDGYFDNIGCMWPFSKCEKVIPDTREKIKEEMASNFYYTMVDNTEERLNLAEQFISRIEALGK